MMTPFPFVLTPRWVDFSYSFRFPLAAFEQLAAWPFVVLRVSNEFLIKQYMLMIMLLSTFYNYMILILYMIFYLISNLHDWLYLTYIYRTRRFQKSPKTRNLWEGCGISRMRKRSDDKLTSGLATDSQTGRLTDSIARLTDWPRLIDLLTDWRIS